MASGEQVLHFRTQALQKRRFLGLGGDEIGEIFLFAVARRFDAQAAEFEAVEFGEQALQFARGRFPSPARFQFSLGARPSLPERWA